MASARRYQRHYLDDDAGNEQSEMKRTSAVASRCLAGGNNRKERNMTTKILIAATALAIAAGTATPTLARSITSDPDALMNEQQKLGPNESTYRVGNAYVTHKHGWRHSRAIVPADSYSYYRGPAYSYVPPAYGYEPAPLYGW
jgi:hypothetical protein